MCRNMGVAKTKFFYSYYCVILWSYRSKFNLCKFYNCTKYIKIIKWFQKITKVLHKIIYIGYKKNLKSNSNLILTSTPNLTASFSTLWFFFADVFICKHRTWKNFKIHSNFYHRLHIWYHEILTNLIILRLQLLFFRILKSFEHTFVAVFPRQDVENFFSFHV